MYAAAVPSDDESGARLLDQIFPAADRCRYDFRDGAFGQPVAGRRIPHRHYEIRNGSASTVVVGLLQEATVNGCVRRGPVNTVTLPEDFTADFVTLATLSVWMQDGDGSSRCLPAIPKHATTIDLPAGGGRLEYRFDDRTGAFVGAT